MSSKFALVIANTEYQDAGFAKLTAPGKDAEEFAHVLREPDFAAFDDVQVLLNQEESKIRRAIARFFVNRQRDDLLLLYFSGHGVRNEQGQLFLAANDTEISILDATGIPADFVTHAMNNSRSQRQLLILDCCNSGAFAHGSKSASAIGKSMGIATAFEGSGFGRVVLTATDATQFAWEGDKVIGNTQKSVFTHFLIEGLKGDADRDGDGRIHVDELYDYAYEQVVRRTPKQTPGKWSYKQQGDLILRENLKARDVKPVPLPSDILYYLDHPSSGVRSTGVEELIRLLDGKHLGLARAAEDKLREIAANDDSLTLRRNASQVLSDHGLILAESLPTELLTEEPVQQHMVPPLTFPRRRFPSSSATEAKDKALPGRLFDGKISIPTLDKPLVGKILSLVFAVFFLGWAGKTLMDNWPAFNSPPMPSPTSNLNAPTATQAIATRTSQGTSAPAPVSTGTISPTDAPVSPTPSLGIGSSMISDKDGMTLLYVPAGEYTMGRNNCGAAIACQDVNPAHQVYLDAFWIDQTEVTNAMYKKCVQDGPCPYTRSINNSGYLNHPVVSVYWQDAEAYCTWANRRLPTEAEWEKAARGEDERLYPWGNDEPNKDFLNHNNQVGGTTEVGRYPKGASPYGALDMAGNVSEWVADGYGEKYYATSPESNPMGPNTTAFRVLRGDSWTGTISQSYNRYIDIYSFTRFKGEGKNINIGFRCARSP